MIIEEIPWQVILHTQINRWLKDMMDWWILSRLKLSLGMVVISFLLLAFLITVTQVKLDPLVQSMSLADQQPPPFSLTTQLVSRMDQSTPPLSLSLSVKLVFQMH